MGQFRSPAARVPLDRARTATTEADPDSDPSRHATSAAPRRQGDLPPGASSISPNAAGSHPGNVGADPYLVSARGIHKRFAGVHALRGVDLDIAPGSIHALVGENGAGKSTLGKVIGGALRPDAGSLLVGGRPVTYRSPRHALADGIALIQQELALVPQLGIVENVFLGMERTSVGVVRRGESRARYEELAGRVGFRPRPGVPVGQLGIADQQKVEILRALVRGARLIVMDEPSSSLTVDEIERLHRIVRDLAAGGTTVIYVSHFLEEVLQLAEVVTVLRNGAIVRTSPAADETVESIVSAMVGVEDADALREPVRAQASDGPVVVSVRELSRRGELTDISFDIRAGEVLGVAGLVGSGRSTLAAALFGARSVDAGHVAIDGVPVRLRSPRDAMVHGCALVPENRQASGLVAQLSVSANVTLAHLPNVTKAGVIRGAREEDQVRAVLRRVGVDESRKSDPVGTLSGGNQQKVLFAKWLVRTPRFLILDEPTRGVDVSARRGIHLIIASLAKAGAAILLISSELDEVLDLSHRVIVMRGGRIVARAERDTADQGSLIRAALGLDHTETAREVAGDGHGR